MPDEAQSFAQLPGQAGGSTSSSDEAQVEGHQRYNYGEERDPVEAETYGGGEDLFVEDRKWDAPDGRADDARQMELNRIERDRILQVFLFDQHRNQRLICRAAERLRASGQEGERQRAPHQNHVRRPQKSERGQRQRATQLRPLRSEQDATPIDAVGDHSSDQGEEYDRRGAQEGQITGIAGLVRERVEDPGQRRFLQPRAGT